MPVLNITASAAAVVYDPADYFDGFTISGDTKTATYVFDGVMPLHKLVVDGVDKGNNVSGGFSLMVNNASEIRISSYLTGVIAWADKPLPGGGIKISDIMPGAELTFSTKFHFGYTLEGDATVTDEAVLYTQWAFYAYDSNGNYLGKYLQNSEEKTWVPTGSNGIVVDSTATYTVGANTAYILPFALSRFNIPAGYGANLLGFFDPFTITADINMIYENSQTMTAIKDKLTDIDNSIGQTNGKLDGIGDSLDQTNDKLDEIISGGEAGEALGGVGDELQGVVDDSAGVSDDLVNDIGSIEDFESGIMADLDWNISQIDISGVSKFTNSLSFISGMAQNIFDGMSGWQIALTLPLFLGLFFGICQHVGGISHVRAVKAREARNNELHEARLEKIRNGGKK